MTPVLILPGHDLNLRTFVDPRGVTHEALSTYQHCGVVSFCGQLRSPMKTGDVMIGTLRAYAHLNAPQGVDCMSCLVGRARLDAMIARGDATADPAVPMVQIELRITSWR